MTLNERLQEAMQHEIADLKEQITNAKYNYLGAMGDCKRYEETIAQQAEAIRLKDAALEKIACIGNGDTHGNSIGNCLAIDALAIQPSPEILQARDERGAEAISTSMSTELDSEFLIEGDEK